MRKNRDKNKDLIKWEIILSRRLAAVMRLVCLRKSASNYSEMNHRKVRMAIGKKEETNTQ